MTVVGFFAYAMMMIFPEEDVNAKVFPAISISFINHVVRVVLLDGLWWARVSSDILRCAKRGADLNIEEAHEARVSSFCWSTIQEAKEEGRKAMPGLRKGSFRNARPPQVTFLT